MKKFLMTIVLLFPFIAQTDSSQEETTTENTQQEYIDGTTHYCPCKKRYKKHPHMQKRHCTHTECCVRNRTLGGAILGGGIGVGAGAAIGAGMTPAAVGAGAAIGGPIGIVGGVVLSKLIS